MKPQEFAKWMREEHDRVHDLALKLREAVAKIPRVNRGEWLTQLRERFEHLRAHLHKHMALEEQDGYLPTVATHRPTLSGEVDRLRHEHDEIVKIMEGIRRDMHELTENDPLLIRDCCRRLENLIGFIEHHEQDENLIVLSAFTDEIGTKD